jgi:hypothetical protein
MLYRSSAPAHWYFPLIEERQLDRLLNAAGFCDL